MIEIAISKKRIDEVDTKVPLTFRIEGKDYEDGVPSLGWLTEAIEENSLWILHFEPVNTAVLSLLPPDEENNYELGVVDGMLRSVIVVVPAEDEEALLKAVGAVKVHSFTLCDERETKICNHCTSCGDKKKIPVKGLDVVEKIKAYQLAHGVSYETAYIAVENKEQKNEYRK